ncbi:MAG: ABC transporter transmembrane domain-containing protein [Sedimenticola sp.]
MGGVVINTVALATSFYTMQVYDRVVPTGATQTLMVLTIGVMISILYELFSKKVRAKIYDRLIDNVDQRLAHTIYKKFLSIRIDQLPQSVGGIASQMRGYETVRSFLTSVTTHLMVDAPFALIFVMVVAMIAGWLAIIPLSMLAMSITVGIYYRSRVDSLAGNANAASNFKTGLLVETVEGAETIKSGQGGWRMLIPLDEND